MFKVGDKVRIIPNLEDKTYYVGDRHYSTCGGMLKYRNRIVTIIKKSKCHENCYYIEEDDQHYYWHISWFNTLQKLNVNIF